MNCTLIFITAVTSDAMNIERVNEFPEFLQCTERRNLLISSEVNVAVLLTLQCQFAEGCSQFTDSVKYSGNYTYRQI